MFKKLARKGRFCAPVSPFPCPLGRDRGELKDGVVGVFEWGEQFKLNEVSWTSGQSAVDRTSIRSEMVWTLGLGKLGWTSGQRMMR